MDVIDGLKDKDDNKAHALLKEMLIECSKSDFYYGHFNDFLEMLNDRKSYVRVRAFSLICALSRWDRNKLINQNIDNILNILNDDKAFVVRKALEALKEVLLFKNELEAVVRKRVLEININRFKDSMSPLIKKDINELLGETIWEL
ncbi:MAG: hypothetical protein Q4B60_07725 [Erysipelotrichaceae bacterium]|nr:hypothetical protein [Erysipelotrichaceae bacterium]